MTTTPIIHEIHEFDQNGIHFSAEASSLGIGAGQFESSIKVNNHGEIINFFWFYTEINSDGDVSYWQYKSTNSNSKLTVFND